MVRWCRQKTVSVTVKSMSSENVCIFNTIIPLLKPELKPPLKRKILKNNNNLLPVS